MRTVSALTLVALLCANSLSGQEIEKIDAPKGVVYNYCDSSTFAKAKLLIHQDLSMPGRYSLVGNVMIIGPLLWARFQKVKELRHIEGGNTTLMVDDKKLSAKLTQHVSDGRKVWDEFRKQIGDTKYVRRKANPKELQYYWSIISFDIDEPLIILETEQERYILNLSPKTMELLWLDQAP